MRYRYSGVSQRVVHQHCDWTHLVANLILRIKSFTVTVTVDGLVKLLASNAHSCPSKYLVHFCS